MNGHLLQLASSALKRTAHRVSVLVACTTVMFLAAQSLVAQSASSGPSPTSNPAEFFLRDGDRVVFLGDSITQQRQYTNLIEAFALTRFPEWKLMFRNAGWGGDTAEGALKRLERDVLALQPTVVTINFGMNDAGYRPPDAERLKRYETSTAGLVQRLKESNIRVALFAAGAVDRERRRDAFDYNDTLKVFRQAVVDLAAKEQVILADQFTPLLEAMGKIKALPGDEESKVLIPDSVHPNWGGHLVMAYADLVALRAPADAVTAVIDVSASKSETVHCRIGDLRVQDGAVTFRRQDEVHPLPLPDAPQIAQTLRVAPILDRLSRCTLSVKGLNTPAAELYIDDQKIGVFNAHELEAGINLSALSSAVSADARAVLDAVGRKNDLYFQRWREVQLWTVPDWLKDAGEVIESRRQARLAELDKQIEEAERAIEAIRRPREHTFRIVPAKSGN